MNRRYLQLLVVFLVTLIFSGVSFAQNVSRTDWDMHYGLEEANGYYLGVIPYNNDTGNHGDPSVYSEATIPGATDGGWISPPNPETIGFGSGSASIIGDAGYGCWDALDFTYFQTFVNIPVGTTVNTFTISFDGMDDGSRITIFNSANPDGLVIPGSYVYLGATETTDLSGYVVKGENRVVITQVDDCPTGNNLQTAEVVLNGQTVAACEPTEQTFTILGANGDVGDIDPYSQSLPAGETEWQPVYLTGSHTWGYIAGTNSWVNFDPDNTVGLDTRTPYRIRFEVPADYTNPSMVFQLKADNRALIWINDTFIDSVDGAGNITPPDAVVEQALHTGLNEIRLTMVDWGAIVGFNYRIDVTMTSCEDITDAVLTPDEAAELNNAPTADAGPDQTSETTSVTLDGSGSSDPDGNLLTYSWSDENGNEIATGENPTINLADGSYTITLTVSDGELTDTDEVNIEVSTNEPPVANAGEDQAFDCVIENVDVTLDGSGSSDEDGDDLTYSWSYNGEVKSADAVYTTSLGGGSHTFTLTVSDGEASSSDDVTVTVELDETAPELTVPEDFTVSNDPGECSAVVEFDVCATDECDDNVTFVADPASGASFDLGETEVTVTATDAAGNEASDTFTVTVEDTEAPTFVAKSDPITLWPPNHKYHTFDATDFVASLDDNCTDLSAADVVITSVSSDEPEDVQGRKNGKGKSSRGGGDGATKNDIVINGSSVDLRAERQGGGNGRVYTVSLSVADGNGNSSSATCQVVVPHSKKSGAVDDGAVYEVSSGSSAIATNSSNPRALEVVVPAVYQLEQNYPNPFNPTTSIRYGIPEAGNVNLAVYDLRGTMVQEMVSGYQNAGYHSVTFEASNLATGVYLYVLEVNGQRFLSKMTLMK
ncbi:MAG: HYR domain-containing protein [Candidatus Marinimicrobia bacterium]|nr:HYR domain-containing protein [Candidatus Neomarinimicrobiota bacterium]MCF7829339.1 HYR domain-containing protein [Candidatus Neomarinimicrobiota bacterium]MCF7879999.1 HYR domain-containing protein [Candidatus Neomarinimicrobiota bacterium]